MQTCIVERVSAPLCAALLSSFGDESGGSAERAHVQLQELERAHLFLAPLDAAHEWYHYHPLWLDALRQRLFQSHPARVRALHQTASRWFEDNQFYGEAVHHALAAQDVERAADIVEKNAAELIHRNEFARLREWFTQLPQTAFETRPQLCLQRAWFLFLTGARQQAEQWLVLAEQARDTRALSEAESNTVASQIETVRSAVQLEHGNYRAAMEHAARAQALLPINSEPLRAAPQMYQALAKFWSGQVLGVDVELAQASQRARATGNLFFAMTAACHQGEVLMTQGRLHEALAHFRALEEQARQWGIEHRPYVALLHVNWGMLYFELNDLDAGIAAFERAQELGEFGAAPREWLIGAAFLAWMYFITGNRARGMDMVARAETHLRQYQIPPWAASHLIDTEQGLEIWDRDFEETRRWLERTQVGLDEPDYVNELAQLTVARVKILHQDYAGALQIARRLCAAAEQTQRLGSLPRLYTVEALMYARAGDQANALERLDRALEIGEARNFVRSIIDEGYSIEELLATIVANPRAQDTPERLAYVRRLLASAQRDRYITAHNVAPPLNVLPTTKPLAPRVSHSSEALDGPELRVLQLFAEGYSNREIADKLGIGVGATKLHINNLFRKLDASSRTQALQRARDLGLLAL